MVPSPNVVDNHQYKNAKALADRGAVILLEEKDMAPGVMTDRVNTLLADAALCHRMGENIATFAFSDANKLIYEELMRMISQNSHNDSQTENAAGIPKPDVMPEQK